eukprot:777910-Pyramimonas_sp.AAC.1
MCHAAGAQSGRSVTHVSRRRGAKRSQCYTSVMPQGHKAVAMLHKCHAAWAQSKRSVTPVLRRRGAKRAQCYTSVTPQGRKAVAMLHKCHAAWAQSERSVTQVSRRLVITSLLVIERRRLQSHSAGTNHRRAERISPDREPITGVPA